VFTCLACEDTMRVINTKMLADINDNISKIWTKRFKNCHPVDLMTPIILRMCVWSCIISYIHWHVSVCQNITQLNQ